MEIQDLLQWLENTDLRLSSKTMWGMPDSASERLNAHLVSPFQYLLENSQISLYNIDFSSLFSLTIIGVVQWDGIKAVLLHRCEEFSSQDAGEQFCCSGIQHRTQLVHSGTEMDFSLQQSAGAEGNYQYPQVKLISFVREPLSVLLLSQAKLTEGLSLAKEFHSSVQEILTKMSKCEESMRILPVPSFVLDTVCTQLQLHKVCFFFFNCLAFSFTYIMFTASIAPIFSVTG